MSSATKDIIKTSEKGEYLRSTTTAHSRLDTDAFPWQENRYCLYIADACGWAQRVTCTLHLLKLQSFFKITVVHPTFTRTRENDENDQHHGWCFANKDEVWNRPKTTVHIPQFPLKFAPL